MWHGLVQTLSMFGMNFHRIYQKGYFTSRSNTSFWWEWSGPSDTMWVSPRNGSMLGVTLSESLFAAFTEYDGFTNESPALPD